MPTLSCQLLAWFDQHGRTHLPWQKGNRPKPNPYHVWLSEIMLQQTQVSTVISYFNRFIQFFPTIEDLAAASEDAVLAQWAGLGYYARARNLHKTAKIITEQYQGEIPHHFTQVVALPGIGRSTAAAILSLSFNQTHAILDGNVKRVLARVHQVDGHYSKSAVLKRLWQLAEKHTPDNRTNHYTQAIMDLGSAICTRTKPDCANCPINNQCQSYNNNTQAQYPNPKPKKHRPTQSIAVLVLVNNGKIHLYKRPGKGIWGGLWSFIECEDNPESIRRSILDFDQSAKIIQDLAVFKHSFTHYHLHIHPVVVDCPTSHADFYNPRQLSLGVPKPIDKIIDQLNTLTAERRLEPANK